MGRGPRAFGLRRGVACYGLTGAPFGFFIFRWVYVLASAMERRLHPVARAVVYAPCHAGWTAVLPFMYMSVEFVWDFTLGTDTGYVAPRASVESAFVVSGLCAVAALVNVFSIYLYDLMLRRSWKCSSTQPPQVRRSRDPPRRRRRPLYAC